MDLFIVRFPQLKYSLDWKDGLGCHSSLDCKDGRTCATLF